MISLSVPQNTSAEVSIPAGTFRPAPRSSCPGPRAGETSTDPELVSGMIQLDEARESLLRSAPKPHGVLMPSAQAAGLVLAEAVRADRPLPPFDRATMDGYAVRSADLGPDGGRLACVGEIKAGDAPAEGPPHGSCRAIMTGAAAPPGADAVVPVEHTRREDDGQIHFQAGANPGDYLAPRGQEAAAGEVLLEPGIVLRPGACGLLALVGRLEVQVYARPSVAVLSTGNEIVPPEASPTATQVRDTNRAIMQALLGWHGFDATTDLGIARDDPDDLRRKLSAGLEHEVLLVSGGVSMGTYDLVPELLAELGVARLFAGVAVKPGKPLWAGVSPSGGLIVALPGNPLAVLVHTSELVVPLLRKMSGHAEPVLPLLRAVLASDVSMAGDRLVLQPAQITSDPHGAGFVARPLTVHGSADLVAAAPANGLVFLAAGKSLWHNGEEVPARVWW